MSDFQSIKYRLIGAAVIVVSFIFAWWLLLDHDVHRLQDVQADIPEPLKIERFEIEKPKAPTVKSKIEKKEPLSKNKLEKKLAKESQPQASKTAISKTSASKKTTTPKKVSSKDAPVKSKKKMSALDSQGLPEAWVLQVASFQEKANAQQLQKKLVAKKLPAYVKIFNLPDGKSYRVLIGPKLSKERVSRLSKVIEKEHGLKSMIMRYKPGFEE